jgi:anaerobic selenocysteine-containing dehydrogenase
MPKITRRSFLRIGAAGLAGAVLAGCKKPRRWVYLESFVRPPEEKLAGVATWYASTCRQCPAGCGIVVRVMNGRALKIEGNPEHPLNRGKLCARGQSGLQLLYNPDRLAGPVEQSDRGSRHFRALSWDGAINALYDKLQKAGAGIGIWSTSTMPGHLYDLFRRFAGAVGAPSPVVYDLYAAMSGYHVFQESSRYLGYSALPTYDLAHADVILSFGADFLGTGLSAVRYGREYGAFRGQPLGKRGYLVQMEPRMSMTGAVADRWLPVRPGSEALIAQALLRIIADEALGSEERVARARALVGELEVDRVAAESDLPVEELRRLAQLIGTADRPLALPGGVLAGQEDGLQAISMVQALNLVAGTASQPGGWSAEQAAPPAELARPQVSSLRDVHDLIERMRSGEVQVLLVHGANPAYDLPPAAGFHEALARVPLVVSFSPIVDETAAWADMVLPDRTYLESWGYEVVSPSFGSPIVGSQQPVVEPVFDARSTGDVLLTVASAISAAAQALPWADEVAFLKEAIGQLGPGAAGGSGAEVLWARFLQHGGWWPVEPPATARQPVEPSQPIQLTSLPFQGDDQAYPYFLHLYLSPLLGDGRGASQPWLQGSPDPMTTIAWQTWVELAPETARKVGVSDGDVVRIRSPYGAIEAPVYVYPAIRPDTVAIPIGQGHTDSGRYARDRGSNPMHLVGGRTGASGSALAWAGIRVQVTPTGKSVALASFENRVGVREGFINQALPG